MLLLLIGYMWLYIHRPFEIWALLGSLSIERVYILTCAVLWFLFHKKNSVSNINVLAVLAVTAAIFVSGYITHTSDESNLVVVEWSKVLFFAILLITSVREERELKIILTGFSVVFFVYMLHSYYEFKFCGRHVYRMGIPRLCGMGDTYSDPNSFGASIVYYLPVLVPLLTVLRGVSAIPIRLFVVTSFFLSVICISDTGSRAAFVGLLAYVFLAAALSKHRWKILAAAMFILPIIWVNMDERMQNRYLTLIDSSRGPANAQESVEGRYEGFRTGMELFGKSPLYGFGPGNAQHYTSTKLQTHNFLGQVAGELGSIGLLAYGFLAFCITLNYLYSRLYWKVLRTRCPAADSYLFQVSQAIFIALLLLIMMGIGSHNAYRYTWVWYAAFQGMAVVALKKKVDDVIREQTESSGVDDESVDDPQPGILDRPASQPGY